MYKDVQEYKESESLTQQEDSQSWARGSNTGFLTAQDVPGESVSIFLPAESCPELPSVNNSIFVAVEVKGQVQGTYFCLKGYHLEGKRNFFCNASKEWNASTPKCRCKFNLSASLSILSSHCILSHPASSNPC